MTSAAHGHRVAGRPAPRDAARHYARDVVSVLGLPFDALVMDEVVRDLRESAFRGERRFVSTPNLNFAVAALSDAEFRSTVLRSDLSLADGMPIVWLSRVGDSGVPERVAGSSLFEALRAHPGPPLDVFFFGAPPGVARRAAESLNRAGSGLRCVGFEDPGFGPVETLSDDACIARINASGAHFVVAALGAKKGQAWLQRHAGDLSAPVLCHLGATVNFVADAIRRSPPWMQAVGLEWLWRVREEPSLWRRYAHDARAVGEAVATRVLPNAFLRDTAASEEPQLVVEQSLAGDTWRLTGSWRRSRLAALRGALIAADATTTRVHVDLSGVAAADPWFVGLLQVALGRMGSHRLSWSGARGPVARVFKRCMVPECTS